MKLQMNDIAGTIITSTADLSINYEGFFDDIENEYFYRIYTDSGETLLTYAGKYRARDCRKDFNKLLSKGAKKIYKPAYIDEQEQAHIEALNTYGLKYRILAGSQSCGNY